MATIIIRRKSSMAGCAVKHKIYIADMYIGELKNGGVIEFPIEVGTYTLSFNSSIKAPGNSTAFSVAVNSDDEIIELKARFAINGFKVEYADKKPHIPTKTNSAADGEHISSIDTFRNVAEDQAVNEVEHVNEEETDSGTVDKNKMMSKIVIKRKSALGGAGESHDVFLLNDLVGQLKQGGTLEVPVSAGRHILSFKSRLKRWGKNATFVAVVNEDEIVELRTKYDSNGEYIVEYADNKPHFPTFSNSTAVSNVPLTDNIQSQSGVACPCCGSCDILPVSEVSTKGKDFNTSDACCGYLLCGPIGLLFGAAGKGKQTTTTTYWMCKGCGHKFKA